MKKMGESFVEWDKDLKTTNPLQFEGYEEKIDGIQKKTGLSEGIITGEGKIHGQRTAIGVCDSRFLMGSMGEVVGEKIVRMFELCKYIGLKDVNSFHNFC